MNPTAKPAATGATPAVADPIHTWGEPTIGVDPQGRVFASGPTGTGTQTALLNRTATQSQTVAAAQKQPEIKPGPPPVLTKRGADILVQVEKMLDDAAKTATKTVKKK